MSPYNVLYIRTLYGAHKTCGFDHTVIKGSRVRIPMVSAYFLPTILVQGNTVVMPASSLYHRRIQVTNPLPTKPGTLCSPPQSPRIFQKRALIFGAHPPPLNNFYRTEAQDSQTKFAPTKNGRLDSPLVYMINLFRTVYGVRSQSPLNPLITR